MVGVQVTVVLTPPRAIVSVALTAAGLSALVTLQELDLLPELDSDGGRPDHGLNYYLASAHCRRAGELRSVET